MKRGFTLLEIILAVTVLALVGTMIYGGFSQTALNKARVEKDVDHSRIVHMALERMARELTMAFVSTHVNPSPRPSRRGNGLHRKDHGKDDRIDFTSFSHRRLYRDAPESDQNEISYFVTEHPDEPGVQVLARREQNRIDENPRRGGKSQILVENVEEFNLEYFDPLLTDWVQTWDTEDVLAQPNRLPTQVRIRLTVEDPRGRGQTQSIWHARHDSAHLRPQPRELQPMNRAITGPHRKRSEEGVALIMAITTVAILAVMLADMHETTGTAFAVSTSQRDALQAEYMAKSATNLTRLLIAKEPEVRRFVDPLYRGATGRPPRNCRSGTSSTSSCRRSARPRISATP